MTRAATVPSGGEGALQLVAETPQRRRIERAGAMRVPGIDEAPCGMPTSSMCVHRKGATPALPLGHPDLCADFAETGQPAP